MILLIGGEKGGSGKSTISVNLASEFSRRNFSVSLLDADRKKSAKNWALTRDGLIKLISGIEDDYLSRSDYEKIPSKVKNKINKGINSIEGKHATGDIVDTIIAMNERSDILIIDVGGGDTEEFHQGLGMADMVICPLKASILDADTIPNLSNNLKIAKSKNRNLIIKALVNEAPTTIGSKDSSDLKEILKSSPILSDICRTTVHLRSSYRKSLNYGIGASEWSDSKAAGEISFLAEEIIKETNLLAKERS